MNRQDEIRHGRYCVFKMHAHLVFVTKYRRHVFTKNMIDDLKPIFEKVCLGFDSQLIKFDGEDDHIHLLVNYSPKIALSSLVNSLKRCFQ
jgi:putative transposase